MTLMSDGQTPRDSMIVQMVASNLEGSVTDLRALTGRAFVSSDELAAFAADALLAAVVLANVAGIDLEPIAARAEARVQQAGLRR